MPDDLYPLQFRPVFRDYMWGGRRLATRFGRPLPEGITAESWEISAHHSSPTHVAHGPLQGLTLDEVERRWGSERLRGRSGLPSDGRFPLLVKLLDANENLSVQVHPDDAYARVHEGGDAGKTELWYVLHTQGAAELIYGLVPGTTRETLEAAARNGHLERVLRRLAVRPGDAVFVPAGTVHALLAGLLVAEIQQNSDTTYRVYDWGRVTPGGQPRPLHLDKALQVIDVRGQGPGVVTPRLLREAQGLRVESLVDCPQFCVERVRLQPGAAYEDACEGDSFEIWGAVEGEALLLPDEGQQWPVAPITLRAVEWALLPAALGPYRLQTTAGCTLLRTTLGEKDDG